MKLFFSISVCTAFGALAMPLQESHFSLSARDSGADLHSRTVGPKLLPRGPGSPKKVDSPKTVKPAEQQTQQGAKPVTLLTPHRPPPPPPITGAIGTQAAKQQTTPADKSRTGSPSKHKGIPIPQSPSKKTVTSPTQSPSRKPPLAGPPSPDRKKLVLQSPALPVLGGALPPLKQGVGPPLLAADSRISSPEPIRPGQKIQFPKPPPLQNEGKTSPLKEGRGIPYASPLRGQEIKFPKPPPREAGGSFLKTKMAQPGTKRERSPSPPSRQNSGSSTALARGVKDGLRPPTPEKARSDSLSDWEGFGPGRGRHSAAEGLRQRKSSGTGRGGGPQFPPGLQDQPVPADKKPWQRLGIVQSPFQTYTPEAARKTTSQGRTSQDGAQQGITSQAGTPAGTPVGSERLPSGALTQPYRRPSTDGRRPSTEQGRTSTDGRPTIDGITPSSNRPSLDQSSLHRPTTGEENTRPVPYVASTESLLHGQHPEHTVITIGGTEENKKKRERCNGWDCTANQAFGAACAVGVACALPFLNHASMFPGVGAAAPAPGVASAPGPDGYQIGGAWALQAFATGAAASAVGALRKKKEDIGKQQRRSLEYMDGSQNIYRRGEDSLLRVQHHVSNKVYGHGLDQGSLHFAAFGVSSFAI